jgi:hypothetical protein
VDYLKNVNTNWEKKRKTTTNDMKRAVS